MCFNLDVKWTTTNYVLFYPVCENINKKSKIYKYNWISKWLKKMNHTTKSKNMPKNAKWRRPDKPCLCLQKWRRLGASISDVKWTTTNYYTNFPVCETPCETNNIIKSIMNKQMIYKIYQKIIQKMQNDRVSHMLCLSTTGVPLPPMGPPGLEGGAPELVDGSPEVIAN